MSSDKLPIHYADIGMWRMLTSTDTRNTLADVVVLIYVECPSWLILQKSKTFISRLLMVRGIIMSFYMELFARDCRSVNRVATGRRVSVLFVFFIILAMRTQALSDDILARARLLPMHLDSCELDYSIEASGLEKRTLIVDGNKFYLNTGSKSKTVAFDGIQHWSKQGDGKDAVVGKQNVTTHAQLDNHPLILPYNWFWESVSQANWSDLRSQEKWNKIIERMDFQEKKLIRGYECSVYKIVYSGDTENFVALAHDLGGFPIQIQKPFNGKPITTDVIGIVKHQSGAVVGTEFLKVLPNNRQSRIVVEIKSLKINQNVDPAVFRFNPDGVKSLTTLDDSIPK